MLGETDAKNGAFFSDFDTFSDIGPHASKKDIVSLSFPDRSRQRCQKRSHPVICCGKRSQRFPEISFMFLSKSNADLQELGDTCKVKPAKKNM